MSAPKPLSEPIHSPTMAPMTAVADAMRSDENSIGMDRGRRSRQNVSHGVAESTRNNSCSLAAAEFNPRTMFTRVGKKQMTEAITIFGSIPSPKIRMMMGDKARIGIVLKNRTTGK